MECLAQKREHLKECEKETSGVLTHASKHNAEQENLKSAITDCCKGENHAMVVRTETNKFH